MSQLVAQTGDFKKGDKVIFICKHSELDFGAEQNDYEKELFNKVKNRVATVRYAYYDEGLEYSRFHADSLFELYEQTKSDVMGNGIELLSIEFDDNGEIDCCYPFEIKHI